VNKLKRLSFCDYIKRLPPAVVFRNLVKDTKRERKIISSELIDYIKKECASDKALFQRFEALSDEAKKACVLVYLFGTSGLKAVGYEERHEELLNSFLIYCASDTYGAQYYFGFSDLEAALCRRFASFLHTWAKTDGHAKPVPFLPLRCVSDTTVLLILASQGLLKKKMDSSLAQLSFAEIKRKLHGTVETCLFDKKEKDTEKIINLILAYGQARGLVAEEEKVYTTTLSQIELWLKNQPGKLYADFCGFAVEYLGDWGMLIFNHLLDTAGKSWLSTSFAPKSCRTKIMDALLVFHYIGFIEAGTNGREIFFRKAPEEMRQAKAEPVVKIRIMPDFSALLPQEIQPEGLHLFALSGEITSLDRVYKGIINRETVHNSLSRGVPGETLIASLQKWEAPENVVATVKEWIREFSRLCIIKNETIIVADEKTSMQVSSYAPLKNLIEPLKVYSAFTVKKGREEDVRNLLLTMGFDPRVPEAHQPKPPSAQSLLPKDAPEELTLFTEFVQNQTKSEARPITSGKYSEELKKLELNELFHVVDYAILMGHVLKLEYEGSPYLKQGVYLLSPVKLVNGADAFVEGKIETSGTPKKFYIKRIRRIGVKSS